MVFTADRGSTPRTSTIPLGIRIGPSAIAEIHFAKMSGAGNDFVVVDNRAGVVSNAAAFAQAVCDRRTGIGADGLLLLESHPSLAFSMMYYNADGSYGGMCGNGGRCISRFARIEGIVPSDSFSFDALGKTYPAVVTGEQVHLTMNDPWDLRFRMAIRVAGKDLLCHFINTGSPHCVIFLHENPHIFPDALHDTDIMAMGRAIRSHEAFAPEGTNVNFVEVARDNSLQLRTYERGVEDETLACGTGSVATAVIADNVLRIPSPTHVKVRSGEELTVTFSKDELRGYCNVSLEGSAMVRFRGTIRFNFETLTIADG